jgi:hypothetical protein
MLSDAGWGRVQFGAKGKARSGGLHAGNGDMAMRQAGQPKARHRQMGSAPPGQAVQGHSRLARDLLRQPLGRAQLPDLG